VGLKPCHASRNSHSEPPHDEGVCKRDEGGGGSSEVRPNALGREGEYQDRSGSLHRAVCLYHLDGLSDQGQANRGRQAAQTRPDDDNIHHFGGYFRAGGADAGCAGRRHGVLTELPQPGTGTTGLPRFTGEGRRRTRESEEAGPHALQGGKTSPHRGSCSWQGHDSTIEPGVWKGDGKGAQRVANRWNK